MASKSKSRSNSNKADTWENREARLLCKAVYDHLAYYIQVQLPEEKFVSATRLQNQTTSTPRMPVPEPSFNSTGQGRKHRKKRAQPVYSKRLLEETSNIKTDDKQTEKKPTTKQKSSSKGSSKKSRSPVSKMRSEDNKTMLPIFENSPYLTDLNDVRPDRKKKTVGMRRKAERVASNASQLLRDIPLDEIMTVQKYRSPYKSLMRCSSSLSQHPNGMLTSNRAIKYAALHDDRERAKQYVKEKRKLHRRNKKRNQEQERRKPQTSFNSYQSKYRSPPKIYENSFVRSSSDSYTSDDDDSISASSIHASSAKSEARNSSTDFASTDDRSTSPSSREEKEFHKGQNTARQNMKTKDIDVLQSREEQSTLFIPNAPSNLIPTENANSAESLKKHQDDRSYSLEKNPDDRQHKQITLPKESASTSTALNLEDNQRKPKDPAVVDHQINNNPTRVSPSDNGDHDKSKVPTNQQEIKLTTTNTSSVSECVEPLKSRSTGNLESTHNENFDQIDEGMKFSLPRDDAVDDSSASDDESSTTSSIRRLIADARLSLSALGSSSDDS